MLRAWPYIVIGDGCVEHLHALALEEDAARTDRKVLEIEHVERQRLQRELAKAAAHLSTVSAELAAERAQGERLAQRLEKTLDTLDRARVEAEGARALAQRTIDAGRAILSELETLKRENLALRVKLEGAEGLH
jgi:septal ring factor EnvC (AmiA/AmiB activator)